METEGERASERAEMCAQKRKGNGAEGERGRNERLLPFGSLNANLLFLHGEADAACHSHSPYAVGARWAAMHGLQRPLLNTILLSIPA